MDIDMAAIITTATTLIRFMFPLSGWPDRMRRTVLAACATALPYFFPLSDVGNST
jgi:hypothetical protein